jgi:short-subunit dehydrogenase
VTGDPAGAVPALPRGRALVTGGSAGLGAAMAARLAANGHAVINIDRDDPPSAQGSNQGSNQGSAQDGVATIKVDLSDRAGVDAVLRRLPDFAPLDWAVLNAGVSATGRFEDLPLAAMLRLIRLNAEAPMLLASELLAGGVMAQGGRIVLVSSLSHFTGYPGAAAYAASKDALAIFAKSLRKAAAARGVTVTTAFPGPLRTAHAERHAPKGADASRRMDPAQAAWMILADAAQGSPTSIPGIGNKLAALAGRISPSAMTALMRRMIYDKLGGSAW